jgi:F0F1-type ATP synthase epsilon subunit
MSQPLKLLVKTPQSAVVDTEAHSIRVLTETGHVGLRSRMEDIILAVEPGLVLVYREGSTLYVGTAGGLLTSDGALVTILTPLAVAEENEAAVMRELKKQLAQPSAELEVRTTINNIQTGILNELNEDRRRRLQHLEASE